MINNHNVQSRKGNWLISLVLIIVGSLFLSGCGAKAAPKVYRVGILVGFAPFAPIADGFIAEMTELGYIQGRNIFYNVQTVNDDPAHEEQVLKQFVADGVDLIFAFPTGSALAAKAATQGTDIPVVFAVADLEGVDLVESVGQPGGNITGVRYSGPDLAIKRFEFLIEIAPQTKRLYLPYRETYPANHSALAMLRPVAEAAGVTLVEAPLTSVADLEADLQARAAADDLGIDAILIMPDDFIQSPPGWPMLIEFSTEHKVPIGGAPAFTADTGALFSYVPDFFEVGELAAPLADKIFNGTPAGTIPLVTPDDHLRVNYKAAQDLGLTVPEGLLSLASEIIQ